MIGLRNDGIDQLPSTVQRNVGVVPKLPSLPLFNKNAQKDGTRCDMMVIASAIASVDKEEQAANVTQYR